MRQLTKAEACREPAMSLSTLDRRIASGDIQVRREQHGRRHRIYVMLDEQVALPQAQLALEQERNTGLEEVHRKERVERDRMRRVAFILGWVATGLLAVGGLVAWLLFTYKLTDES